MCSAGDMPSPRLRKRSLRLSASSFYTYYRPSRCELRVWLRAQDTPEAAPSPYERVLRTLGERHETQHLGTLSDVVDLRDGRRWFRELRTRWELHRGRSAIYQGRLRARVKLAGRQCEIVGEPDFLLPHAHGHVIRDSKLTRRVEGHPEVGLQLQTYGWLYEQVRHRPPAGLEVHAGTGDIVAIDYDGGAAALSKLDEMVRIRTAATEPYSPVGWSKCSACGFRERCWPRAEARRDVALVPGVDQGLARVLRDAGTATIEDLLENFDTDSLSGLKRPWGRGSAAVGSGAARILKRASAIERNTEILLGPARLPVSENYVMFDLEGLPPQLDDVEKVYLWGLQVFGAEPSEFLPATAGFGVEGDRQGWTSFLRLARLLFDRYGDLPFVHWAAYEKSKLDGYVKRFGDPAGIAARVRKNLVDLLPLVQQSVALPLPSYSLKVVEKHLGFSRVLEDAGGDWAMAEYIKATETHDERVRTLTMRRILAYNREDLEATWAVFQWLATRP